MEQGCIYMWIVVQSFPYPTFPISAKVSRVLKFWFCELPFQLLRLHTAASLIFLADFCFAVATDNRNKIICDLFLCSSRKHLEKSLKKIHSFWCLSSGLQFLKRKGNHLSNICQYSETASRMSH